MLALLQTDDGPRLRSDHPVPADLAPGDARIALAYGGVCATDLEIAKGYMGFRGIMGHEFVGVVEAVGAPDAHGAWIGRRVVGEINCPCMTCPTCLAGRPSHCPNRTVLGIAGRDGAFAERLVLPVSNLHAVPDAVSDEAAAFVEPLAAACQIAEQRHVRPSSTIAVLGVGRLGQMCARVLALSGARVVAISRNPARLTTLPRGIERVLSSDARDGARTFDVVVDCTGNPDGLSLATELVRPRGTIILKTTVHDPVPQSPTPWVIDEVTLVGSRCGPFAPALRLLERGLVDPVDLVTARFPLTAAGRALATAAQPDQVKVLIAGPACKV